MKKIKYTLGALAASLALALGVAMPVGATSTDNNCVDNSCNNTQTETKHIDNSKTVTLGDCSIYGDVSQNNSQNNSGDNDAEGGDSGDAEKGENNTSGTGGAGGSNSQSNTASNNITLTCTTNNVTNTTAAPQVLAAQTDAPKGGVSAGAGGAVTAGVSSIVGLFGSLATVGAGLVARRKFEV